MKLIQTLRAPLGVAWSPQHVCLKIPGLAPGAPVALLVNGRPTPFQYTGQHDEDAAEVMVRLGFKRDEEKTLEFVPAQASTTTLTPVAIPIKKTTQIGRQGRTLTIGRPFAAFGAFPVTSRIRTDVPLETRTLTRTNDGPLFTDYLFAHRYADHQRYDLRFRCYQHEPIIEVSEEFLLGMGAALELTLNPRGQFDSILSRDSFEGEIQPTIEPLAQERPRDVLCRLQMPVLTEYFVPNNRGWFALFHQRREKRGMVGILGLYGARWEHPVENMMKVAVARGRAVLRASLESGTRYWALYLGPLEKKFTPKRRLVFHRLHAEFNQLRLDEHLDLTDSEIFDKGCWNKPGFFGENYRAQAQRAAAEQPPLRRFLENHSLTPPTGAAAKLGVDNPIYDPQTGKLRWLRDPNTPVDLANPIYALLHDDDHLREALRGGMERRFEKWVVQFQGFRVGKHDYCKNVIGFSRMLRRLLIAYELLRKDQFLTDAQIRRFHSYFGFAARTILDEGRWPHSKTWRHPDHPESVRDVYTYPGEHKPDKLIWTNCLPNFQSDPMTALVHLSAILPEHPDALHWRRFALDDIDRQLDAYCSPSGAWEESINYALFTGYYLMITLRTVKNRWGIDYFQDERCRRFIGWLTRFFGPFDKRVQSYTFPGIGNSSVPGHGTNVLLAYASELPEDDPLRQDLIATYQLTEPTLWMSEDSAMLPAGMPCFPDRHYPVRPLASEHMQDLGVAMRHGHPSPTESYLFQKIGFWKDHYEADETSFNWYAKGTPLTMDYGTYTPDVGGAGAHNVIEIPESDSLRRGYLAECYFTPVVDYSRSEVPVTLKLQHGYIRNWAEIDGPPKPVKYFYLCDENPVGPKTWKSRQMLFVKPDYLVLFDRVFGAVPHRFNLHITANALQRDGATIHATGKFDLDLLTFVQHPAAFEWQEGELIPGGRPPQTQRYFRLYNTTDGVYRTVHFAQEKGRPVALESFGEHGIKIVTAEFTDYAFVSDEMIHVSRDGVRFDGRVGWIRRTAAGQVLACAPDADRIAAFGVSIDGRGPWSYNLDGHQTVAVKGMPREVKVQ